MNELATLRFEPITERHIESILPIEAASHGAPWSERSFRNEINHEFGIYLVAMLFGKVAGYGGVWLVIDEAHVTTVTIAEEHRRLGIGQKLVTELLRQAKEAGMVCSSLEVRASNEAAIALYEKIGFERTSVRRRYYPDNDEDAAVMWLHDLGNWEPRKA